MRAKRLLALGLVLGLAACFGPSDRRPGTKLPGEVAAWPADWAFADSHKEIAVEVSTPWLVPHSVTVWCATLDGALYTGARDPDTKRWPALADRNPNVRLGIGESVYEVRLVPLTDEAVLARLRAAYAVKYALPAPAEGAAVPPVRYWKIEKRV